MSNDKSDDDKDIEFTKWFIQNYPIETYVSKHIQKNMNAIFDKVPSTNKIYPIDFRAEEINGKLTFTTNDIGLVFLGVLGKSIIELISFNLEENLSSKLNREVEKRAKEAVKGYLSRADYSIKLQDFKRCPKCSLDNDYKNKFCYECGAELSEP